MNKPKIGVIGKGYWGSKVINYINEYFDCAYHIGNNKEELNLLMADAAVKNVMIITPIETHYTLCKQALLADKNVFCEKPVTLHTDEALELKKLAEDKGLVLTVEYTHTFSRAINKVLTFCIPKYGRVQYYEMTSKHLGRFMEHDVYWLLASHFLAVLDMFEDLDNFNFNFIDRLFYKDICTTGGIFFDKGRIEVSVNYTAKDSSAVFYFKNATAIYNPLSLVGESLKIMEYNNKYKAVPPELINEEINFKFNESNNLKFAVKHFYNVLEGKEQSNISTAIKVTKLLENH